MKRAVVFVAALSVVLSCSLASCEDDPQSTHEHLKGMSWAVGDWVAEFTMPPGYPSIGPEGAKVVISASWRWMLKRDFMVVDFKREVDGEMQLGKEIIGWDARSEKLVHWLFWNGGFHGDGEWSRHGDTFNLKWSMTDPDKKTVKATSHFVKIDKDTFTWQATDATVDGESLPDWPKVTYKRKLMVIPMVMPERIHQRPAARMKRQEPRSAEKQNSRSP
jgi:hypothetical protein